MLLDPKITLASNISALQSHLKVIMKKTAFDHKKAKHQLIVKIQMN